MDLEPGQAELREAAVLIVDLRGFTPLSARLSPPQVMALLADYQGRMVAAIRRHGGSVDKFLGDGILASFGAVRASATFAADAARAVEAVVDEAAAWAEARRADAEEPLAVGVALASGRVMFGCVGDHDRLEYTVIGEAVNLAAKLEKHGKAEAASALLPAETLALAEAQGSGPRCRGGGARVGRWRACRSRSISRCCRGERADVRELPGAPGAGLGRDRDLLPRGGQRAAAAAAARLPADPRHLAPGGPGAGARASPSSAPTCAATATAASRRADADARGLLQARDGAGHGRGDGGAGLRALRGRRPRPRRPGRAPDVPRPPASACSGRRVLDIVPTRTVFGATDMALATGYYHWFFLIQPEPLPERLIGADPLFYLRWTLAPLVGGRVDRTISRRGAGRI